MKQEYKYFYTNFLDIGGVVQGGLHRQALLNPQRDFSNCKEVVFFKNQLHSRWNVYSLVSLLAPDADCQANGS